jgi:ribosomal protein S18 acetylase RimI-like enzyme
MKITTMKIGDYDEIYSLWKNTEGMGLHALDVDSKEGISRYLKRNRGMSFIARDKNKLVGTVLCGTDGRRGYLFHLAVDKDCRKQGIGKAIVDRALSKLASVGISKCVIFVFEQNTSGKQFWEHIGWTYRPELLTMVTDTGVIANG